MTDVVTEQPLTGAPEPTGAASAARADGARS